MKKVNDLTNSPPPDNAAGGGIGLGGSGGSSDMMDMIRSMVRCTLVIMNVVMNDDKERGEMIRSDHRVVMDINQEHGKGWVIMYYQVITLVYMVATF